MPHELALLRSVFQDMGYVHVLRHLTDGPAPDDVLSSLYHWRGQAGLGPSDMVVVYFAGHTNSHARPPEMWTGNGSLRLNDLFQALKGPLGHVLFILDTAFGGPIPLQDLADVRPDEPTISVLASVEGVEREGSSVFARALAKELTDPYLDNPQPFRSLGEVAARVETRMRGAFSESVAPSTDSPVWSATSSTGPPSPFFPSVFHSRNHSPGTEKNWDLVGRTRALATLSSWLADPVSSGNQVLVVTGAPGSGKTALLRRLLDLADPTFPDRHLAPAETLPPTGMRMVWLNARHGTADQLLIELADALDAPYHDNPEGLRFAALREHKGTVVVLLDGLDEVSPPEEGRIVAMLLALLNRLLTVRVIVSARTAVMDHFGLEARIIDLDDEEYSTPADVAEYARRRLLNAGHPESQARDFGQIVAQTVNRSFLLGRLMVDSVLAGDIDLEQPNWKGATSGIADAVALHLEHLDPTRDRAKRAHG
ncbi:AAA family ATPase [Streptomyces sp. NPDC058572]|uniref:AAA family ATPase n=1 Tax=Streptomyces sp. NPDC058572 TaxID=3346546 RepID=UPI00364D7894